MEFHRAGRDKQNIRDFIDGTVLQNLLQHFGFTDGKLVTRFIISQPLFVKASSISFTLSNNHFICRKRCFRNGSRRVYG